MKFSSLPTYIQRAVIADAKDSKYDDAMYRMRYYAANGYTSAQAYFDALMNQGPTTQEVKESILSVMKERFIKNGAEAWMDMIPNSEYICRQHKEDMMLSKAERYRKVA